MRSPATLLLAARTIVQFPRNPILLGFSLAPTAILLTTVPGIGNAAVALAGQFQSGYVYKLLTAPISTGSILLGRLLGDGLQLCVQSAVVLLLAIALGAHVETGIVGAALMIALGTLLGIVTFGVLTANLALRTRDAAAVQAILPMAYLLIFLSSAYRQPEQIDSPVIRTIIDANPAECVLRPMRELMRSGYDWPGLGVALAVILALALVGIPLTVRNYRSVYS